MIKSSLSQLSAISMGLETQGDDPEKTRVYLRLSEMDHQDWYNEIYDKAPTLCMVMNTEGVIIDCNLAYARALGYSVKGRVIGHSIFECADERSRETLRKSFEIWRKTGRVHNNEFTMRRADGSVFPALINATSIHDELGRTIACNAVILNITELANARKSVEVTMNNLIQKERELHEMNEELKRVERAKEEFVSMISHELKNPLTPIIGFSDLLRKQVSSGQQLADKQLGTIQIINQNAKEMKRLIDDILSVYKLDMRLEFSFSETKIVDLVEQVLVELSPILEEKGIRVDKSILLREGKEMSIMCDALRIRQVLVNLVRNSVDFLTNSGGEISLTLEEEGDQQPADAADKKPSAILFTIVDNGPGVPLEKVSGLFKKFYQVNPGAARKHGGTGLGLTICKEIIERHGGKIWYDATYEKGACFRFVLPRSPFATQSGKAG